MSVRMGKKFTEMGVQVVGAPLLRTWRECIETSVTPGCYPVALAVNFAAQGLPAREAFVVHQYGVAATILGAALRLMKISHVETQKILYELNGARGSGLRERRRGSLVGHVGLCAADGNPGRCPHQGARAPVHELILMGASNVEENYAHRHRRPGRLGQDRDRGGHYAAACSISASRCSSSPTTW